MNRKNVIESVLYIGLTVTLGVLFLLALSQRDKLQETLNEKEKVISDMGVMMERQEEQLTAYQSEIDTLNIQFAELSTSYEKIEAEQVALSDKVSVLEEEKTKLLENVKTANSKAQQVQAENDKLKASAKVTPKVKGISVSRSTSDTVSKTINVTATAYTAYCNGCSGVTAVGIDLRKNPDAKVIAVDPRIIPLGTKVYVEGYGYAIAGDTGGAIKGHKIDLFMPSQSNALKFGRQTVQVKILK